MKLAVRKIDQLVLDSQYLFHDTLYGCRRLSIPLIKVADICFEVYGRIDFLISAGRYKPRLLKFGV